MEWLTFEAKAARGAVAFHLDWRTEGKSGSTNPQGFMDRGELDCFMIENGDWRVDWKGKDILAEDPIMSVALDKAYDRYQSMWLMPSFDKPLMEMDIAKGKCNCGPDCDWKVK